MKLAEDRDLIKIKLTKAMNMNIELSRQLMKYQKISLPSFQQQKSSPNNSNDNNSTQFRTKSPVMVNSQIKEEVAELRRKCSELDEIYHHLKHHLCALRNVFVDLGINQFADSGSGYHLDYDGNPDLDNVDEDSITVTSMNSSVSASVGKITKQNSNNKNSKNNITVDKTYLMDNNNNNQISDHGHIDDIDVDSDDNNYDGHTDFRPLPPMRSSMFIRKTIATTRLKSAKDIDDNNDNNNNNNNGTQYNHYSNGIVDEKQNNQLQTSINLEQQERQLSNFDIWYNSKYNYNIIII